ncbi:MAG: sigma-70 family RNA polymerase sigma factor [Planctomycetota bacterium]
MTDPTPETTASDEAIQGVIDGRSGAWEELVHLWSRRVYAAAQSRLRDADAAEEVTQAVMVTVYEQISRGRYSHTGQFESWLFRIVMNRVRDVIRVSQRRRTQQLHTSSAPAHSSNHDLAEGDDGEIRAVRLAVAELPEADQEILSLRHHAQLGFASIAEMLEQPLGTVLARHHRALAKLRARLEQQLETEEVSR